MNLAVDARLSPKEARFVSEYLVDLDACRAALAAGYSATMARSKAFQWVSGSKSTKPRIMEAVKKAKAAQSARLEITADAVVAELAKLGFANMLDFMQPADNGVPRLDFSRLTRDQAAALAEVTVEETGDGRRVRFKLADKRAALVDLGRHFGIFKPERLELMGKDGGPIDISDVRQRNLDLIEAIASRKAVAVDPGATPAGDGELNRE